MSSDVLGKEPERPRADLSRLPDVLSVKAVVVRFKQPLIRYKGRERVEYKRAIELMVRTSGPIPERALSPVLMVGDVPVDDYEAAGENLYRFYAFEIDRLKEGAPVRLEWPRFGPSPIRKPPIFKLEGEERR